MGKKIMKETNIFKVLADQQRREILIMLKDGRLNAGEIAEKLQVTPAALSYHLKLLKSADLVSEYKEKNFIFYEINTTVFDELILWINQFGGAKGWKNHVDCCGATSGGCKYDVTGDTGYDTA